MSQLKILDTGYVANVVSGATQLSDANRAGYTGSAVSSFTLKASSISYATNPNIEQKPIIGSLTDNSSSLTSINPTVYTVSFILAKTITTSGWDVNNVYQFLRMDRTYGLKLLYPSSTGDSLPTIVEAMGQANIGALGNFGTGASDDGGTVATTTPYLLGRVRNIRVGDSASDNSYWKVSFDFVVSV